MEPATLEEKVLTHLNGGNKIANSTEFAASIKEKVDDLHDVLKSLQADEFVVLTNQPKLSWVLTKEGKEYFQNGTPEYQLFNIIVKSEGIQKADLDAKYENLVKFGLQNAMKRKWFAIDKSGKITTSLKEVVDEDHAILKLVAEGKGDTLTKDQIDTMKKRKLIEQEKVPNFAVEKGAKFQLVRPKKAADLTIELLEGDAWKTASFKAYNFAARGKELSIGCLHPLLKVRSQFRQILLEMGFEEMPTNRFVESSFWNFDSLFQPQQHPARDAHDTFFMANPAKSNIREEEYLKRVQTMHQTGGQGSIGWRYDWSKEEARKNILRTHTTAVSSQMLYKLAQEKEFKPKKWFSIDRVFRNENLDATHLAEFHQIEGLVVDKNIGLAHLKGTIREFFRRIGITNLKFKPAYNPYTEPSMEIFGYHPILAKWVEIGNSGVFRPEMLGPMNLPPDVSVIAWGLSLERPTMIQYSVDNIRELFGHQVNIKKTKENAICCFN